MKMTIDLPLVSSCSVNECVYNAKEKCHARAITIGNGVHPDCDTFLQAITHVKKFKQVAGVGACKVSTCGHNQDFECIADQIEVGRHEGGINCLNFNHP